MKEFQGREEHQERGSVGVWQGGVEGTVLIGLPWVRGGGGDRLQARGVTHSWKLRGTARTGQHSHSRGISGSEVER